MLVVPESPVWLDLKNAHEEEKKSLKDEEKESTNYTISSADPVSALDSLFCTAGKYKDPLFVSMVLVLMHQMVGASITILHSNDFIHKSGGHDQGGTVGGLAIGVGITHFAGSVFGLAFMVLSLISIYSHSQPYSLTLFTSRTQSDTLTLTLTLTLIISHPGHYRTPHAALRRSDGACHSGYTTCHIFKDV